MNIEKLRKKSLSELVELKKTVQSVCDDYANNLTTYATLNGDPTFQSMPQNTQMMYKKRLVFVKMLETIKPIIEEKLMEIYGEQD